VGVPNPAKIPQLVPTQAPPVVSHEDPPAPKRWWLPVNPPVPVRSAVNKSVLDNSNRNLPQNRSGRPMPPRLDDETSSPAPSPPPDISLTVIPAYIRCSNGPGWIPPECQTDMYTVSEYWPNASTLTGLQTDLIQQTLQGHANAVAKHICALPTEELSSDLPIGSTVGKVYYTMAERIYNTTRRVNMRSVLKAKHWKPPWVDKWDKGKWVTGSYTWTPGVSSLPESLGGSVATPPGGCNKGDDFSSWLWKDPCSPYRVDTASQYASASDDGISDSGALGAWAYQPSKILPSQEDKANHVSMGDLWYGGQIARMIMDGTKTNECAAAAISYLIRNSSNPDWSTTYTDRTQGPPSTSMIALHVRRGDSCARYAEKGDWNSVHDGTVNKRPCYKLETYMAEARKMKETYGVSRIAVSTDSDAVIQDLINDYSSEGFEFLYLQYNRSLVGGPENINMGKGEATTGTKYIEDRDVDEDTKALIFSSAAAEMRLLSECNYFIGTSLATMSRFVLTAIIGRLGYMPPYVMLDKPFVCVAGMFCPAGKGCGCYNDDAK